MKKNYNYPKTEEVQLNGCSIMQSEGGSGNGGPHSGDPNPDPFLAPKRQV